MRGYRNVDANEVVFDDILSIDVEWMVAFCGCIPNELAMLHDDGSNGNVMGNDDSTRGRVFVPSLPWLRTVYPLCMKADM